GSLVAKQQALQVAGQQVDLQVYPTPRAVVGHDGLGQGVRDDGQLELGAIHRVHRQAGAIDGDRALEGDVLGQVTRRADAELHGTGVVLALDDLADTVDMAADQVAAETAGGSQGLFQVDRAAGLEVVEGGAGQGLAADVGPETVTGQLHGGEADTVDGDAVAQLDVGEVQLAGFH